MGTFFVALFLAITLSGNAFLEKKNCVSNSKNYKQEMRNKNVGSR